MKTTIQSCTTDIRGFLDYLSEKQVDFQGQLTRFYVTSYREYLLDKHYILSALSCEQDLEEISSFIGFSLVPGILKKGVIVDAHSLVYSRL